jgi:F-type H+-transporting ATPase subunit b
MAYFGVTEAAEAPSGIAALGINLQAFLFQLVAFLIVLWLLRKFAYGPLVKTLETRRQAVIDSLDDAKETADKLANAQKEIESKLNEARDQAKEIVDVAHKEAAVMVEDADQKAQKRADHIVKEARSQLDQDVLKARETLKKDATELVALATEKIIKEKLTSEKDQALIKETVKGLK